MKIFGYNLKKKTNTYVTRVSWLGISMKIRITKLK